MITKNNNNKKTNTTNGFKKPTKLNFTKQEKKSKKIFIYGIDGSGKSEFAQKYCNDNNLKPVVFDFDQTNFSSENILNIPKLRNGLQYKDYFLEIIKEVKNSDFDTIIFDNVTRFFELLIGSGKGLLKYAERGKYWKEIRSELLSNDLNLIWTGQINTSLDFNKDSEDNSKPSEVILSIHALSNEKYECSYGEDGFVQIIKKYRGHEDYLGKTYDEIKN